MGDAEPSDGASLRLGSWGRFHGVYYAHWEWSRFEVVTRSRWPRRRVLCELVSETVPWPALIEQAGEEANMLRGPGARFAVTVDAAVTARGNFGHLGLQRWLLSVRCWVAVARLP